MAPTSDGNMGHLFLKNFIVTFDWTNSMMYLDPLAEDGSIELISNAVGAGVGIQDGKLIVNTLAIGGPADEAGLKSGDVVVEINGRSIKNAMAMRNTVGLLAIGQTLDIVLLRDGKRLRLRAVIEEPEQQAIEGEKIHPRLAGAVFGQVQDVDEPGLWRVVVLEVAQGSPAWYSRLRKGDRILSVNQRAVRDLKTFQTYVRNNRQLVLNVQRGSNALFVLIK